MKIILKYIIAVFFFINPLAAFCDGFIVVPDHPVTNIMRSSFPLEVKYHHVDVKINERYAETRIDQVFYNGSSRRLEGHYIFPVPKGAAIKKFSMYINGKEVPAELLPSDKARKIYEDIVRKQIDPALLEYYDLNIFKARIFPIEPYSKKRVKISYSEILEKNNGTVSYTYPLNTEKFSSKPLKSVLIDVSIKSKNTIKNLYSTTHEVDVRRFKNRASLRFKDRNTKPDRDFKIFYTSEKARVGLSLLTKKLRGQDGFFFMDISPGFEIIEKEIGKKNVVFVLDVSGSMAGEKLDQAKKALNYCINSLNIKDSFDIVSFSTESESLFGKLMKSDKINRRKALEFVRNLRAVGGTNIEDALKVAMESVSGKGSVIFITDGKPTIGKTKETDLINIIKKNSGMRIFTFGIGETINTHLLDKMTGITNGYRSYVGTSENIETAVSDFFTKISYPVLTDIRIKTKGVKLIKMYPGKIPDLYKGASVTLIGRYRNSGNAEIELSGILKNKRRKIKFKRFFPLQKFGNDFIPSLWAARRVGFILDQIRLNGESKELKDEVVRLARRYGIITPYTSYLILEDERIAVRERRGLRRNQTLYNILPERSSLNEESKNEYDMMKQKFGKKSIRASKEVQALNKSKNYLHTQQGKKRMVYKDRSGEKNNLTDKIIHVAGRAFYNTGKFWVDSLIEEQKGAKTLRIRFNSREYYRLIRKGKIARYLSLGKNIRFVSDKKIYEVYE